MVAEIDVTAGEEDGSPNIQAAWSPPYSDVPIDSYNVTLQNSTGGLMQQVTVHGAVSVVIGEVERGREYLVSVVAMSAVGKGKDSQPVRVRTFDGEGLFLCWCVHKCVCVCVRVRVCGRDMCMNEPWRERKEGESMCLFHQSGKYMWNILKRYTIILTSLQLWQSSALLMHSLLLLVTLHYIQTHMHT